MIIDSSEYKLRYDKIADTLYIYKLPIITIDVMMITDSYIIVRKYQQQVVGIAILGFCSRCLLSECFDEIILEYFENFPLEMLKMMECEYNV